MNAASQVLHIHQEQEITPLAKRLLAASSLGIYITQDSGHRYINIDMREFSYRVNVTHKDFQNITVSEVEPIVVFKEYGSFAACLKRIEEYIAPRTLLEVYDDLNYGNTIVGTDRVE